jgi:D-glycero-alpha-D-manno-heptose-7-phosphate kinase
MAPPEDLEIHHNADLPAHSGPGSSSAFTVGLLNSLYALAGHYVGKVELTARAACIEQHVIGGCVGCLDQLWAAHGGSNRIDFNPEGTISMNSIISQLLVCGRRPVHMIEAVTGCAAPATPSHQ